MSTERRDRILETVLSVRPGEFRLTSLMFLQCLAVVGTFIVGRSVRDALFLAHGSKESLPWMYILSAIGVAVMGVAYSRVADRIRRDWLTAGTALAFGAGFVAFRLASGRTGEWIYAALYIFVEMVGALTIIQFWTLANDIFNSRDAKRLFGTIGAGGTLANILLGGAVGVAAKRIGAENLLLLCMVLLVAVAVLALKLAHRVPVRIARGRSTRAVRPGASRVFSSAHLKLVAGLVAFTYLATTLIDYQFKVIAAASYPKDELASFFGNFYAVTGFLALGVQFFGTSRLLSRFGVIAALAVLPAALGLGSVAILVVPVLAAATATKGSEFVFRYTINDATTQLLYLPVAANVRAGAKGFIDGVVKPGAIALSGLLLLAYKARFSGLGLLSTASIAACAGWGLVVWRMRGEYVRTLQDTLRRRRLDLESARLTIADGSTAGVLLRALESVDPKEVLNALELLPHAVTAHTDLPVARLLAHPSAEVRVAALDHLGRSGSLQFGNAAFRLFEDPDSGVRAAAIDAFCAIGRDKAVRSVKGFLKDPSARIRAAAIVSMIRYGGLDGVLAAAEALKTLIADPDAAMREEAARVLGAIGVKNFYQPVLELMNDPDPKVRRAAVGAAGALRAPELTTALIYRLAREETAPDAVEALSLYATGIEATLERVLDNPLEDPSIRRNVPRVLGRLGTPEAVGVLTAHLADTDEAVRRELYRALGKALRRRRGLVVDRRALNRAVDHELACAFHALACAQDLSLTGLQGLSTPRAGQGAAEAMLGNALSEKVEQCEERIFILLGILYPEAEVELIYAGFRDAAAQDAPRRRANAIELLDNVLDRALRRRLFPLLEDAPRTHKLRAAGEWFPCPPPDPNLRTREILADESAWVRACALFYAGERADVSLQEPMAESLDHPSPIVREACLAALAKTLPAPALVRAAERRVGDESKLVRDRARAILEAGRAATAAAAT